MQAVSVLSLSPSFNSYDSKNEFEYAQLSANFSSKLKIAGSGSDFEFNDTKPAALDNEKDKPETEESEGVQNADAGGDCLKNEDEDDFSFVCTNPDGSPISADDIFQNGQIRPVYPIFNRDLLFADADDGDSSRARGAAASSSSLRPPLKKLFFEERDTPSSSASESDELEGVPEGTYCEWSRKTVVVAPELKNKSNSTGSSKLWRVRDLKLRSNSDGKDAFVFLNPNSTTTSPKPSQETADNKSGAKIVKTVEKVKGKAKKAETVSSAHEKHYVMNRAKKEGDKRRSYLPYRQDLVGFFTNVNGLSRNVHPF
ncbi:PREDICTED: Protein of unknown function DUF1645 [Prunus dulcis]|uniref:Uncharacterized protein n=1 Tax=Prunus dulcis TaxID=3755 RepID=A0A5E4EHV9_PRUDU|nr:uncharacterized protein LOC117616578 [Prunus dulcis]VVA13418.1 PREDICTED: Protein of unknown function DUF1645 [Prunus dulcis]